MVEIILSTYDGEAYLRELLNSILGQGYPDWRLLIRDDGSKDKTHKIINEYCKEFTGKIILIENHEGRLGPSASFGKLMEFSTAPYVMFCDQDDIWLKDKIQLSLNKIKLLEEEFGVSQPLAVYTDAVVTNKDLKIITRSVQGYMQFDPQVHLRLKNLIWRNIMSGNTMLINRPLVSLSCPVPQGVFMHDWWVGIVACAFGHIGYLPQATILYRQHDKNVCGFKKLTIADQLNILARYQRKISNRIKIFNQLKAFDGKFRWMLSHPQASISQDLNSVFQLANLEKLSYWERKEFLLKFYKGFSDPLKVWVDLITL